MVLVQNAKVPWSSNGNHLLCTIGTCQSSWSTRSESSRCFRCVDYIRQNRKVNWAWTSRAGMTRWLSETGPRQLDRVPMGGWLMCWVLRSALHERGHVGIARCRFHPTNANYKWLRSSCTLTRPISEHHRGTLEWILGMVSMAFTP